MEFRSRRRPFTANQFSVDADLNDLNSFEKIINDKYGGSFVAKLRNSARTKEYKMFNRSNYNM